MASGATIDAGDAWESCVAIWKTLQKMPFLVVLMFQCLVKMGVRDVCVRQRTSGVSETFTPSTPSRQCLHVNRIAARFPFSIEMKQLPICSAKQCCDEYGAQGRTWTCLRGNNLPYDEPGPERPAGERPILVYHKIYNLNPLKTLLVQLNQSISKTTLGIPCAHASHCFLKSHFLPCSATIYM